MAKKLSLGRQKIEMTKIKKKTHLQVTFSKRRSGLFKKASELCTLCGVEIGIVVFSPAGKAFSFGHPSVESIMSRFLKRKTATDSTETPLGEAYQNFNVRELNSQLTQVLGNLENAKKQGELLNEMKKANQAQCWWEKPIDVLGFHEVEMLKSSLEDLKKNVDIQVEKLSIETAKSSGFFMNVDQFERKVPSDQMINATTTNNVPHGYNFGLANGFC